MILANTPWGCPRSVSVEDCSGECEPCWVSRTESEIIGFYDTLRKTQLKDNNTLNVREKI